VLSIRVEGEHDAGELMQKVIGEHGAGGGHASMAGGRIPLGKRSTRKDQEEAARDVETRFINIFGMKRKDQKDLV
jgi:nanoRNase/pAp phosphatase (c-di-AMP/oligoRNAs hydrolase)